jgi:hypothetical protein
MLKKLRSSSISQKLRSSSISQKSLSSNLGLTPLLYDYLIKFCSFPAISLLVRPAGRMLDIAKLKLNSASLVGLGLGLSLAIVILLVS